MASDTYYKDMWLRRNKAAVQVVIVLLSVIAVMLVLQIARRPSPESSPSLQAGQMPEVNKMVEPGGPPPIIRGRVFGQDDEDEFDPKVDDQVQPGDDVVRDKASDCCTIYDLWQQSLDDFECAPMTTIDETLPETLVCFYPPGPDTDSLNQVEPSTAKLILKYLTKGGESYGFIDVGAGLGPYSILSASIGRSVLAVEANTNNIARFHKAAKLGRYERWITLLSNQVAAERTPVTVVHGKPEVKQILLDDLPAFCKFRKAVMRLEVGGQEHIAFQHARFLFKEIQITYVLFTWSHLKVLEAEEDLQLVDDMMKYFNKRGYVPRAYDDKVLSIKKWQKWPDRIYWHKM